jgi:hypothetical protein
MVILGLRRVERLPNLGSWSLRARGHLLPDFHSAISRNLHLAELTGCCGLTS